MFADTLFVMTQVQAVGLLVFMGWLLHDTPIPDELLAWLKSRKRRTMSTVTRSCHGGGS